MNINIKEELEKALEKTLRKMGVKDAPAFLVDAPRELNHGDYSTNAALVLAKAQKKNPLEVAQQLAVNFTHPLVQKAEAAGPGFVNFYLTRKIFQEILKEALKKKTAFGKNDSLRGKKVMVEHTQPNPFKEFHIGHLMNNAIGESVARTIKANGAEVKTVSYHGDVGLHVAKTISVVLEDKKKNGELYEKMLFSSPREIVHYLAQSYALGNIRYLGGVSEDHEKEDRGYINLINKKIYNGDDDEINAIYAWGKDNSLKYFETIYQDLDSHFDYHFYESEAAPVGKKIIESYLGTVFDYGERGAIIFKGEKVGLHTRVFINADGLPTYEGKEVGLAKLKTDVFKFDRSVTVTANEQDAFFKVVEAAIGQVFLKLQGKLTHLSHGTLRLPEGKMSSRTGNVVIAEQLLGRVEQMVVEKVKERDLPQREKQQIIESVAVAAVKYSILKQAIGSDIVYDFQKSISFEGDSGPYLQYSYARAKSILRKATVEGVKPSPKKAPQEIAAPEKMMIHFPEMVLRAGRELQPHLIANYLTELAREFNAYYAAHTIVDKADEYSPYKVAMAQAFSIIMENGLWLLGIRAPEQM